jgi:2-polyprenyl-3-methyl-5-hydroxy-6-metoxy-1,4-benzoquinol methylase
MNSDASVGTPVGNYYDKYGTRNPLARWLVGGFLRNVLELTRRANPSSIHEVGCGEGELTHRFASVCGCPVRGSDFSAEIITEARRRHADAPVTFEVRSIYDLGVEDGAGLMVCCEVLEHLERPEQALAVLAHLPCEHLLFSVPSEPTWRLMNMARGKYLTQLGNTPGHLQHWSSGAFLTLLGRYFEVVEVRRPFPWTMALCRKP